MLSARGPTSAAVALLFTGCGGIAPRPNPSIPQPAPSGLPTPILQSNTWSFDYKAGVSGYEVRRSAVISSVDSAPTHEVTANLTHEILSLERIGDTIQFALAADTFATTTQGLLGPAQTVSLPVRITGSLVENNLEVSSDSLSANCNVVESALRSDLQNLILPLPLPQPLTRGMAWRDSLAGESCQGMVPTTAHIDRSFTVVGEVIYNGAPVVVIERKDTIRAHGNGAQQQHQIIIDVTGSGTAIHYLSTSTGRTVGVTANQQLDLAIAASGHTHHFRQDLKQEFVIGR
jgi:hypothetical protein